MGARESTQMTKARKLVINKGMTASAASEKVGLTRSAIYMSKWYKDWKAKQNIIINSHLLQRMNEEEEA